MKQAGDSLKLSSFLDALAKDFLIYSPVKKDGISTISLNDNIEEIDWSGSLPENSWKSLLLPGTEKIMDYSSGQPKEALPEIKKTALVAVNVLDLRALALFDLVFSNDAYYQKRRRKLLIVGYGANWPNDYKKLKPFSHNYEEDILEHVPFDVFIAEIKGGKHKFYTGSEKGQEIMEKHGFKNYDHVEFAGPIPEEGLDKRMMALMDKVTKSSGKRLWDELGKICLACGKCSSVCPTCFCFDLEDKSNPDKAGKERCWGNCFYNDFSKVAGGHKELNTPAQKLFFWYTHKFVRIPFGYKIPGCVSCGRCTKVCPVGIDIAKNISTLMKMK